MATVRMKRGDLYADIFDSEETIATAKAEGFSFVVEEKLQPKTEDVAEKKPVETVAKQKRQSK